MGRRDFGGGWVLLKSLRIFGEHFAKFRKCCPARANGLLCLHFFGFHLNEIKNFEIPPQ